MARNSRADAGSANAVFFVSCIDKIHYRRPASNTIRHYARRQSMIEPFPLIEISGPPRERGRQYGKQATDRIRKGVAHYTAQLHHLSLDAAAIVELVRDYRPVIERF